MPERERCFSMGSATLSWPEAVDVERFVAAERNSAREDEAERGMRFVRALVLVFSDCRKMRNKNQRQNE